MPNGRASIGEIYRLWGMTYVCAISDFFIQYTTDGIRTEESGSYIHDVNGLGQNAECMCKIFGRMKFKRQWPSCLLQLWAVIKFTLPNACEGGKHMKSQLCMNVTLYQCDWIFLTCLCLKVTTQLKVRNHWGYVILHDKLPQNLLTPYKTYFSSTVNIFIFKTRKQAWAESR